MADISEEEHNEKLREKSVIAAIVENRWTVELTENIFDLFEDTEWVDEDTREEVRRIHDDTEEVLNEFELLNGYDTDKIRSLDESAQRNRIHELAKNTRDALEYSNKLLSQVEGHYDVVDELRNIVENEVEAAFEDYDGFPVDVELNYGDVAQQLEQNLNYEKLGEEIGSEEFAALVAADLEVNESKIASSLEVNEELIADYLDEQKIGEYVTVETRFNGNVNVDKNTLEAAFEDADLEAVDYDRIEHILDRSLEVDVVDIEDQTDYRRIENILERKIPDDYATQEGVADEHSKTRELIREEIGGTDESDDLSSESEYNDESDGLGSESYDLGIMEKIALIPIKIGDALNYGGDDR
ncbi:MAG: hypothetical protein ABEJ95_06215 [Candidatus Nanohalobium sp.]